jgi:hypothetical protein
MALTRFMVDAADVARVPELTTECPSPVGLLITGGDPITLLAAYGPDWPGSWGLWITTSAAYPPQLLARDVKTLSHLMSLDHLVVADERGLAATVAAAAVVRAMLDGGPVTMATEVATLSEATNYPAPPRPIRVWHEELMTLVSGPDVLSIAYQGPTQSGYESLS